MGDSASQPNAQSLRNLLVGLSRFEQFPVAIQWARENHLPHLHQPPHKGGWLFYCSEVVGNIPPFISWDSLDFCHRQGEYKKEQSCPKGTIVLV